jgi:hypothetical protein
MKTAPAIPPPRPPKSGNVAGGDDWPNNPNWRRAKWLRFGQIILKVLVVVTLAVALSKLAAALFQFVRIRFFA